MMSSQIFGLIGTALVVIAYIPQITHLLKEHCSAGISRYAYTLWFLSALFLLIHSYLINDKVFVILQIWNIVASGVILLYSIRFKNGVCETHRFSNVDYRSVDCRRRYWIYDRWSESVNRTRRFNFRDKSAEGSVAERDAKIMGGSHHMDTPVHR
jgi:uncharacterized protein with PQ loop repeat